VPRREILRWGWAVESEEGKCQCWNYSLWADPSSYCAALGEPSEWQGCAVDLSVAPHSTGEPEAPGLWERPPLGGPSQSLSSPGWPLTHQVCARSPKEINGGDSSPMKQRAVIGVAETSASICSSASHSAGPFVVCRKHLIQITSREHPSKPLKTVPSQLNIPYLLPVLCK
jgi:hypothetical protein